MAIIATKNRAELLENRSLSSVLKQSLMPDLICVVDDSDNQDTINQNMMVIEKFRNQLPSQEIQHLLNDRTPGAAGSWNSAIDYWLLQTQSPENTFIAILDDDDEWTNDYLKMGTENIRRDDLDMVACDFYRITEDDRKINEAPNQLLVNDFLIGNPGIQGSNIFIRLSCFLEAGGFDENIKSCTDRDLCIRITDLGDIRYKRIAQPLMNHFAEKKRQRMSTPNTETKNLGLQNFWLKYSKRMTNTQKEGYLLRAKKLFDWQLPLFYPVTDKTKAISINDPNARKSESFSLLIGVICSSYKVILPLITQLETLQKASFIDNLKVVVFENNLQETDKKNILRKVPRLNLVFITETMQNEWVSNIGYFKDFFRNQQGFFSIAQARTMLQKYIGQMMSPKASNEIVWILDEDMQIMDATIDGLKVLPQLKSCGLDIVLGKYEYASPNPPINGARVQLVDFWHNLNWLLSQGLEEKIDDFTHENDLLIQQYPDYYYDLSRKHYGQLEHPFWLKPLSEIETAGEAIDRLCTGFGQIFGGTPLTRPLKVDCSANILNTAIDSVNRGGMTFILNKKALESAPNLNMAIKGTDIRRSDMVWAVINKYYRKMVIKAVNIPIFHIGKEIGDPTVLDVDKIREEVLGSCLYAGLTDFLKLHPDHNLEFLESEVMIIWRKIEGHLQQRMTLLNQSFYRARGISKSLKGLRLYSQKEDLQKCSNIIDAVFSKKNFQLIEQNIALITHVDLSTFLRSMQCKSDAYLNINLQKYDDF